jgi:hypothetical protein
MAEENTKQTWLEECCRDTRKEPVKGEALENDLFASWRAWAERGGHFPGTQKTISEWLSQEGFQHGKNAIGRKIWRGINVLGVSMSQPINTPEGAKGFAVIDGGKS